MLYRHDHSRIVQRHQPSFVLRYEALAIDVQRNMLEYATELFNRPKSSRPAHIPHTSSRPPANTSENSDLQPKKGQVELETENGIPIMPAVMDNRELRKDYLVELVRKYLTAQCGKRDHPLNELWAY